MKTSQMTPFFSSAFSTLPICNIYFWIWNYIKLFSNSLLWSILVCKLPQFFPKSYWFGQLIILLSCPNQLKSILSIIKCKLSFLILRTSLMCVRGSRSFTTHSGNHTVNDFEIAFDYTLGGDLLVWWDLKGRVCFESSLKKILGRVSIVPDLILLYCFLHTVFPWEFISDETNFLQFSVWSISCT